MKIKKPEIRYIGKKITYRLLKDIIHEEELDENDTIILNFKNLDDIVLEYRQFYGESMTFPHYLLDVQIVESESENINYNRIGILKDE